MHQMKVVIILKNEDAGSIFSHSLTQKFCEIKGYYTGVDKHSGVLV